MRVELGAWRNALQGMLKVQHRGQQGWLEWPVTDKAVLLLLLLLLLASDITPLGAPSCRQGGAEALLHNSRHTLQARGIRQGVAQVSWGDAWGAPV